MRIAFNPSTVEALITPPNNKDITFDLRGRNIFARGVKFCGTDTNTWRDIKINNVSIGSNILDLRNGSNTTLTNTNGVVTINSTWRPVVDNLTNDSTTSSLSANLGRILKSLIDGKSNSGHTHDDRYLKLTGGTMASNALITFADSGSWGTDKGPQGARGGLYWTGQSDYAKLYAEETAGDNLDLVIQFGDDNSNGLSIRNKANTQTSYISAGGVITTGTFKGNLDWSYITNKPSSYTPSAHTHAWNSLTHSSTTENQAILTNGKANGWKLYTLNISRWDNAANNAHSHSNKSVLDGITSGLVNNWNTAFTFVNTITGTDTDKVINKWDEIVNFLAGITEDNKLNTLLNSKLSVYELANNTNVGTIKNNGIYYSTSDASSGTLTNSPFNTGFTLINMTSLDNGDDLRRSRLAFNAYGEIKVSNDRDLANTAETWYNVLTSKNSGINGSTIKLNGTSITVYSSSTADGRYVKKSGDTMSGVLTIDTTNFGALIIKRNDDANGASIQFRGKSSVYGYIGLNNSTKDKLFLRWGSDTSKIYTILDTSSTYTSNGKGVINGTTITQVDNATNSTNSTNARKLVNWYSARPTSLNTQFGDGSLRIFYATSSTTEGKPVEDSPILHLAWDNNGGWDTQLAVHTRSGKVSTRAQNSGTWQPWKTLAFTTDIPSSLKNPYALTISLNGTSQGPYDGSAAKNINITPSSIGAATSGHNHDSSYVKYTKVTKSTADNANATPYLYNVENEEVISGYYKYWYIFNMGQYSGGNFGTLIAMPYQDSLTDSELFIRSAKSGSWRTWRRILHSNNYASILDSRYYTESEVNSLLDAKLNRQNLSYGTWNPRGYNLAADYYYNGGDLSISESGGKIHVSVDGYFWLNEGQYRVLDTSDVAGLKSNLTVHLYLSNTDTTWWPLIWGGSSHNNTSDSTGTVYKSYDKLSWLTSSLTLYATNIQTNNIKNLSVGGGIYWNPYVESTTDGSDAASITLVKSGVAGGTTLVLSLMNDTNDTILFQTNGSARLYHNSYPILTTLNTYVSNNKGYINGTEITLVNNANLLDGLDWNNFFSRRFYTFNLSSYSLSNFYPLFFVDTDIELDCEIHSENVQNENPYNQNRLHFQITSRGWSDTGLSFHLLSQNNYVNNEITIGSIGIGTRCGGICIWVRGGRTYRVYSNREPLFKSSNYTYCDEIYSVGTNIWGGTNTNVNLVWKNDSTRKNALIATLTDNVASATNADMVDGYHASGLLTSVTNSNNGISITVGGTTKSVSNISVNYASSAGNADTVDGYHATNGRTFTGNINWSGNWNDAWSDGTNKHPWYGFDHRYPNTGAYSTTISDYFGMTIKTSNTLRLDFGTLLLNGTSIYSINVASASKLQTARSIWGHSFNGTADVNGTIYINNNNSSEGAIRLNNNINSNARISAIDSQVIFNTDAAIRFGGTSWDWNVWAGLKYNHSNKTIYLGLADGSIFNANSALSGGSLRFPGISNVYATTFNGSLSGNASTATNADKVDGYHASKFPYINNNGIWRIYGNAAVAALADNTAGLSSWAFGESRNYGITYLGILKPSTDTCGINAHGTIAVFGQGDTHLGIASDYGRANLQVFGGNADKIVWRKKIAFTDSNVASAIKLQTPRTIWGQRFDGTADVSGSLSNTGTITASTAATYDIGSNALDYRYGYFLWIGAKSNTNLRLAANNSDNQIVLHTNGNVGIGTNAPAYKLHVNGTLGVNGITTFNINNQWLTPSILLIGRLDDSKDASKAIIGVTNGNLHIDAYHNKELYLNYYNKGKIRFGYQTGSYYISENGSYYSGTAASANNASTATKLQTTRNIALGTDLRGSANFDGSSNITISANINACTVQVSSTNGLPFKRIAHFETGGSWNDNALLLYISLGYINGSNGICRVEFRTDNISSSSTSVTASAAVRWLVRNGYGLDSLYAGYYVTTSKAYIDIYLKTTSSYQGTVIRVLLDSRGGINSNVLLINSYYYSDTNHKEAYNSIEAASTALYNRAYTRIVSGSDVGTVSYSNSTGSVHWNNVTGKPTMPSNITATKALIVTISGSTVTVNASLDAYKTPGEFNIFGTSNGDYAKMYVQSGIGDAFNGARVITQTIKVTISHNTYAEICDVTRLYKSNAWSKWTVMYLGND